MTNHEEQQRDNTLVIIAQIAALLLVFAVPVTALLLIFPDHTTIIALISVYAIFAIAALFAGIGWQEPTYTRQAKIYTVLIIALTVAAVATSRWQSYSDHGMKWTLDVLARTSFLVIPFFLGRFIKNQVHKVSKPHN